MPRSPRDPDRRTPATLPTPAARRLRGLSVPPAPRKTAEGDEADQDDDQTDPKAPDDHQHDPDDDNDPASRYPGDSSSILSLSHALSPLSAGCPPAKYPAVCLTPAAPRLRERRRGPGSTRPWRFDRHGP